MLVGDRAQDVLGAAAHGLPCIGAGWGPAEDGELEKVGAAAIAATPADVRALLTGENRMNHGRRYRTMG